MNSPTDSNSAPSAPNPTEGAPEQSNLRAAFGNFRMEVSVSDEPANLKCKADNEVTEHQVIDIFIKDDMDFYKQQRALLCTVCGHFRTSR